MAGDYVSEKSLLRDWMVMSVVVYLLILVNSLQGQTFRALHHCHNWTKSFSPLHLLWFDEISEHICRLPKK